MSTEMLINYVPGEECRIALTRDGKLEEFYQERESADIHVSNIYKGRVTNVEPAIQAAFVDFGLERNGFLHTSDVHPMYFPGKDREEFEKVGQKTARRDRPPIQKCLKRGDEVLVQVLKEGLGNKGPTVTSYLSIPGRYLVMMPNMSRSGVSRKVEDDEARREMKDILKELDTPEGFGFIVRTAGIGQTKTDLKRDLAYLMRLWKDIERRRKRLGRRVGELYAESDLVIRTIRDVFTPDVDRIVCDDLDAARRAHGFLAVANPRSKSKVVYYDDHTPLLHRHAVEPQIETISAREVPLPSGGALVFDQTEALVAIDVNSGKSRDARDAETNAYKTNQEAVDEICRQLRLRDLGGLVVMDLIDMMQLKHRKSIEARIKNNLKTDRAKSRIGMIGPFGMLEMTRQRMRPSLETSIYADCRACQGRGYTLSAESVLLSVMRRLAVVMQRPEVKRLELTISPDVAFHLLNRKRTELTHLEEAFDVSVLVRVGGSALDSVVIAPFSDQGIELSLNQSSTLAEPDDTMYREMDDDDLAMATAGDEDLAERHAEAEAEAKADEADEAEQQTRADAKVQADAQRKRQDDQNDQQDDDADRDTDSSNNVQDTDSEGDEETDGAPRKKRRRRRRGGRKHRRREGEEGQDEPGEAGEHDEQRQPEQSHDQDTANDDRSDDQDDDAPAPKRRRPSRSSKPAPSAQTIPEPSSQDAQDPGHDGEDEPIDIAKLAAQDHGITPPAGIVDLNITDGESHDEGESTDTPSPSSDSRNTDRSRSDGEDGDPSEDDGEKPKRRRRRRGGRRRGKKSSDDASGESAEDTSASDAGPDDQPSDKDTADAKDANQSGDTGESNTPDPPRKKFRKRNAPPPPDAAPVSTGYSNRFIRDDR